MNTAVHAIAGGDFERAGSASRCLKEMLKKIGVEPETVRRAMIAAYEAEMNVVIHAQNGTMDIALDSDRVDVAVRDRGPGIPDIERAMQEGFSTAPPAVRVLGFGAGMGLPSIRRYSDRFTIQSTVGQGTQLRFTIFLEPHETPSLGRSSVLVAGELCRQCLRCLHCCPTGALRVRDGKPQILEHLCIDCTACIGECPSGALSMDCTARAPEPSADTVLVGPTALLSQFGAEVHPQQVVEALRDMGFADVRLLHDWEQALRDAVAEYAREETVSKPVIAPLCPAVVNLVETRFPSLLPNVAPFLFPIQAAQQALTVERVVVVVDCPAQHTALVSNASAARATVMSPAGLFNAIAPVVMTGGDARDATRGRAGPADQDPQAGLHVSGISHVMRVLETMENGLLPDVPILEMFACDQGCPGSPVWKEDPFIAQRRWRLAGCERRPGVEAVRRDTPLLARAGVRLDADMSKAIAKLGEIDGLIKRLPGRDCGMCGAPTCAAMAEDVVLGRTEIKACPHLPDCKGAPHEAE